MESDAEQIIVGVVAQANPLVDLNRFSSLRRLTSVIARVLEARDRWLKRNISQTLLGRFALAERISIKISQQNSF